MNPSLPAHGSAFFLLFQRKRKIEEIATPLSRLAMTINWESIGLIFDIDFISDSVRDTFGFVVSYFHESAV